MRERIQKIMSARGVSSRRAAEKLIANGRVFVNGRAAVLGDTADPELDKITLDGAPLPPPPEFTYIMLNKPRGYVTTMSDERGRKTVADLTSDLGIRVYPVGRLDIDSEGLLLMTNDGELANALMHPSGGVRKTYVVKVSGDAEAALPKLAAPIEIDGYTVEACEVAVLEQDKLQIVISEGRNRQIRRMCEAAGLSVIRLTRVAEGGLTLKGLKPGKWRYLTAKEEKLLRRRSENG